MADFRPIQSVQRAVDIMNCFSDNAYYLSLNDISNALNLNINTTRGLVQTLVKNDILVFDRSSKLYSLGYFFNRKSRIIAENRSAIVDMCAPLIHQISEKAGAFCSLQLVQSDSIIQVYNNTPENTHYRIVWEDFLSLPLHSSASGKLLLTYKMEPENPSIIDSLDLPNAASRDALRKELIKIRLQGYATEKEEFEIAVYSIAIPLFNAENSLLGTISISGFVSELANREAELLTYLRYAKNEFENKMFLSAGINT